MSPFCTCGNKGHDVNRRFKPELLAVLNFMELGHTLDTSSNFLCESCSIMMALVSSKVANPGIGYMAITSSSIADESDIWKKVMALLVYYCGIAIGISQCFF